MKTRAVIFDMDGLLIDSEPLWQDAEISVFRSVNVDLNRALCLETQGLRVDEMVDYWFQKFPWKGKSREDVATEILDELVQLISQKGTPMEGVDHILRLCRKNNLIMGIASSSPLRLIRQVVESFEIESFFSVLCSAECEDYGKPHPAVYLNCAAQINVKPKECLAFEDSINGLISAKSASMKAISIPDKNQAIDTRHSIANQTFSSLSDISEKIFEEILSS